MTSRDDEQLPRKDRAKWVNEMMRRRIERGVWRDGHPLPSEKDLMFKPPSVWLNSHLPPSEEEPKASEKEPPSGKKPKGYMSQTTARAPVIQLEAIGRAIKHHGKLTVAYMPSMAPHWLVVDLPKPWSMKLAAVAEPHGAETHPAIALVPAKGSKISFKWDEGKTEYEVPEWNSEWLGIDTGTKLRTYTMILLIDKKPILTSTSFVPSDLLSGPVTWRQKEPPVGEPVLDVGELALDGVSLAFDNLRMDSRIPTLDESELLKPVSGIPAYVAYRQCQVTPIRQVHATSGRACVVVVARADRVHQ